MALPASNTPWPPPSTHATKVAEWSAWYSGDPDQLAGFYGSQAPVSNRPSQYAGGAVGRIARWWWGTPVAEGEQRTKLHVPLAADICGTSADLLFSESVKLATESESMGAMFADLQEQGLDARLHEGAEVAAGLGGVYLRSVWDTEVSPLPWTEVAHPDGAVPEWRGGRLHAVSLWTELPTVSAGTVHRLVERHAPQVIEYRLYAGTGSNLGRVVPLEDHPDAAYLALVVNEDGVQLTGTDRLTARYVPNMLPDRQDRHSIQGRSDLQGVEPFLDALDEAYSSWWRDIRQSKGRLHVPAQYLDTSTGPGTAASFDLDRETYVPVQGVLGTGKDGLLIEAQQFDIRVTQHRDTCEAWTTKIIESAGYSTQSLSSGTGGAVTAAEVRSHERRSYMTRGKKIRYWTPQLRAHLQTQVELANHHMSAGITAADFAVEFADGVQESALSLAQTASALRTAEAASIDTRVSLVNPDWTSVQVDAEVAAIMRETGQGEPLPVPDDAGL